MKLSKKLRSIDLGLFRYAGRSLTFALLVAVGVTIDSRGSHAAERIVLVTIDTLRADHVGAYGGPVETPALDALAAEGALLEQAVTPVPTTGPAHASLFTGLHPWRHGTLANALRLDSKLPVLAERLAERGPTAAFVSSFIVQRRFGFGRGFGEFRFAPSEGYRWRGKLRDRFWARGADTVAAALDWITQHSQERFFVWVHLFDPHTPYEPPERYLRSVPPFDADDLTNQELPRGVRDRDTLARLIRRYRGEVVYADAQIGRLLERLALLGIADSTAVIVTSDHGEGLGDHRLLEHGRNLYDELIRVPLIVRAPGVPAGQRLRGPAQLEDLYPTVLSLAELDVPGGLDGIDLLPWLRGQRAESPREWSFGQRRPYDRLVDLFFARRWPDKWIGERDGQGVGYALNRDPGELRGGAPVRRPPALVEVWARGASRAAPIELDAETQRALEALGYGER